jgi:hypothetical protein
MFINVLSKQQYDQYQKQHNIHTYTNIQIKTTQITENKSSAISATFYHE